MIERSPRVLVRVAGAPLRDLERWTAPDCTRAHRELEAAEDEARVARAGIEDALYAAAGAAESEPRNARLRFGRLALRRAVHSGRAVLPVDLASALGDDAASAARISAFVHTRERRDLARGEVEFAWRAFESRARTEVRLLAADPAFLEALRFAAPELALAAERLHARDVAGWRARERQVAATLVRYAVRRASKTTPHGLFCSTAVGGWGVTAEISGDPGPARLQVRIDVAHARRVVAATLREQAATCRLRLNPSLMSEDRAWFFWRPARAEDEQALETRIRIAANPALDELIEHLRGLGADAGESIAQAELHGWTRARARRDTGPWLTRLVDMGLLQLDGGVSHLESRPLRAWARKLARGQESSAPARACAAILEEVEQAVDALERAGDPPSRGRAHVRIDAAARELPGGAPRAGEPILRVDTGCALHVRIPESVGQELERLLPRYARVFAALYPRELLLAPWVERFLARHAGDREFPLVELWHGTFEPMPRAATNSFLAPDRVAPGAAAGTLARALAAHARWKAFFAQRVTGSAAEGAREVGIEDSDWDALAGDTPPPRFACGVLFQGIDMEERSGPARVVWNALYGAGLATARLADLHRAPDGGVPGSLVDDLREGWAWLGQDGAIVAEIPFGHAGRTANAGLRPRVFDYEIGLPGEIPAGSSVLPLSDLVIRYDTREARFIVRSRRLDRRVVPVLPNGLSPEGVIAFLVAVGQQDLQPLALFPECDAARHGPFPRVVSGATVLFRRRFRLEASAARAAFAPSADERDCHAAALRWQLETGAPRHVFVATDQETKPLYVDFDSPALTRTLSEAARAGSPVTVREMLPGPGDGWAPRGREAHALEFLAHLRFTGPPA